MCKKAQMTLCLKADRRYVRWVVRGEVSKRFDGQVIKVKETPAPLIIAILAIAFFSEMMA